MPRANSTGSHSNEMLISAVSFQDKSHIYSFCVGAALGVEMLEIVYAKINGKSES